MNIRTKNYKERKCRECKKIFKPKSGQHYSCSDECKIIGYRRSRLAEYYRQRRHYILKNKEWVRKNPERMKNLQKEWAIKNKDIYAFHQRRRKANIRGAAGNHSKKEWGELKKKYNYMCLCCKQYEPFIKLTEDHILPISRGGSDYIENIQPLCSRCNSIKGVRLVSFPQ